MKYREIMQKHRRNAIAAGITALRAEPCLLGPACVIAYLWLVYTN